MRIGHGFSLVFISGLLITFGITGMRTLRELQAGRSMYLNADTLRMESITRVIGTTPDSRLYIYGSYLLYKHELFSISRDGFRLEFCERPLQSIAFLPFIPAGRYMPILTILVMSILFPLSLTLLAYILSGKHLDRKTIFAILTAILFGSFYATRLLLDGWVSMLLALWIVAIIKRRAFLSIGITLLLSLLRPELTILFIFLPAIYRDKSSRVMSLMGAIIIISSHALIVRECGDQSHFFEWTINAYEKNIAREFDRSQFEEMVRSCVMENRSRISGNTHTRKIERDCFKKETLEVLKEDNPWKLLTIASLQIARNAFDLALNFTINNRLNRKSTFPLILLLTILYDAILIYSSANLWRSGRYRFLFALWIMLLFIYSAYYPFGLSNPSRWKIVLFPVEISIISLSASAEKRAKGAPGP